MPKSAKTQNTAQNLNENLPNRVEPSKTYIFCSGLGVSRATQPPPLQILCKLAPPKTKSNGLTAAPRRKPFLVRFAPASWKRADSGPGSGSQFLNPRGATPCNKKRMKNAELPFLGFWRALASPGPKKYFLQNIFIARFWGLGLHLN